MRLSFAWVTIFSAVQLFGVNPEYVTRVEDSMEPSVKQLRVVQEILKEAMKLKEDSADDAKKIEKARGFLERNPTEIVFNAQILCEGKLAWDIKKSDGNEECWDIDSMCFRGNIGQAVKLIRHVRKTSLWDLDENWYENPRVISGKLILDAVDGPGESRSEVSLDRCK